MRVIVSADSPDDEVSADKAIGERAVALAAALASSHSRRLQSILSGLPYLGVAVATGPGDRLQEQRTGDVPAPKDSRCEGGRAQSTCVFSRPSPGHARTGAIRPRQAMRPGGCNRAETGARSGFNR